MWLTACSGTDTTLPLTSRFTSPVCLPVLMAVRRFGFPVCAACWQYACCHHIFCIASLCYSEYNIGIISVKVCLHACGTSRFWYFNRGAVKHAMLQPYRRASNQCIFLSLVEETTVKTTYADALFKSMGNNNRRPWQGVDSQEDDGLGVGHRPCAGPALRVPPDVQVQHYSGKVCVCVL